MASGPTSEVAPLEIERTPHGLALRGTQLHLEARGRPELAFIPHASEPRATLPERIVSSPGTLALLEAAQPRALADSAPLPAGFGQSFSLGQHRLTLLPAGHVRGSAMLLCERDGKRILYAADVGGTGACAPRTAEGRAPISCDTLILRAVCGHPRYLFPPRDEVLAQLVTFVRQTLDDGLVPVVLAAPLGGAQEAALHLGEQGHRLRLHPAIHRAAQVYEKLGVAFQDMELFEGPPAPGEVVIIPEGSRIGRRGPIGAHRAVLLSHRALEEGIAAQAAVDLVLPLSDFAGFDELCALAESSSASRIITVHGFAAELAHELRSRGHEAHALFSEKQLELPGLD